jgi:nucleoside recognition membrane protein YjiH
VFGLSQLFAIIAVVVLVLLIPAGLLFFLCKTIWKGSQGKAMQIFSIVLSILAIAIALIGLGGATIWKGNSGEWAPIALLPAFIIGLPAGAVALVLSLITRSGVPRLRKISIGMSVAAVVSPFIAAVLGGR